MNSDTSHMALLIYFGSSFPLSLSLFFFIFPFYPCLHFLMVLYILLVGSAVTSCIFSLFLFLKKDSIFIEVHRYTHFKCSLSFKQVCLCNHQRQNKEYFSHPIKLPLALLQPVLPTPAPEATTNMYLLTIDQFDLFFQNFI